MADKVRVAGVGMIPFSKPGRSESYPVMAERAARAALADAGIPYEAVQQAYAGYVYGDSTVSQSALYSLGLSGIPVVNVNNNCATGSSALWLARQAVTSGAADCVLAVGFEQMRPGALSRIWEDRPDPLRRLLDRMTELQGFDDRIPVAAQLFGGSHRLHRRLRHRPRHLRQDRGQGPPPRGRQSVRRSPHLHHRGRGPRLATHLRAPDPTAVLPAHLRGRGSSALQRGLRPPTRGALAGPYPRPGHDHRFTHHLQLGRHDAGGGLRHDPRGRPAGVRGGRNRARGHRRCRAARLLHRQRADHLRSPRTHPGRHR